MFEAAFCPAIPIAVFTVFVEQYGSCVDVCHYIRYTSLRHVKLREQRGERPGYHLPHIRVKPQVRCTLLYRVGNLDVRWSGKFIVSEV